jgi:hypothetical protein
VPGDELLGSDEATPEAARAAADAATAGASGATSPACCNCRFIRQVGATWECRFNPPSTTCAPVPQKGGVGWATFSWFPLMRPEQWCRLHEPQAAGAK